MARKCELVTDLKAEPKLPKVRVYTKLHGTTIQLMVETDTGWANILGVLGDDCLTLWRLDVAFRSLLPVDENGYLKVKSA